MRKTIVRIFQVQIRQSYLFISLILFISACNYLNVDLKKDHSTTLTGIVTEEEVIPSQEGMIFQSPKEVLANMSLDEKLGQLFFVSANGDFTNVGDESYQRLQRLIKDYHIGGLIYFRGDIYGQAVMTNQLQSISEYPLWITQDMEFGAAMRVRGTTRITPAMGVAATGNPQFAFQKGLITAIEAKAIGVHHIFAPVVDVNNNPANPVINVRSFSEDPEIVSRFGKAFIEGVQSHDVVATAKHFPGHGDTNLDSHYALPTIRHNWARLDSIELVPFKAAIEAGVKSIMSAHIAFPEISSNPSLPGTLDGEILHGILRDSLNFDGLIVTDALEMEGIASYFSPGHAARLALQAGADMLLISPDELTAIDELKKAVERGELSEERIDESVLRLLKLKFDHGLFENRLVDINELNSIINTSDFQIISDEIAKKSITVLRNNGGVLPIRPHQHPKITVISMAEDQSGSTGSGFARAIRDYHPDVTFHVHDRRTNNADEDRFINSVRQSDLVIIGSHITVRPGSTLQLTNRQSGFIRRLANANTPVVLVAFGNPYIINDLPDADVHLAAWSSVNNHTSATAAALFGAAEISGRMPISIPGLYKIGDGLTIKKTTLREDHPKLAGLRPDSLFRINALMKNAISDSIFPGGQVAVIKDGILAYHEAFGYHDYNKREPVKKTDMYDIASLTKVVGTTLAAMKLKDDGRLNLDDRVSRYYPEFRRGDKEQITIRHLLTHTSGLPAFKLYVDEYKTKDAIFSAILNEPLINEPGKSYVYSDLGFIILADIIEKIAGENIDRYLTRNFYYPLGMQWTLYNPHRRGRGFVSRIPPSEIDTTYRHKEIKGEVQDERAYYMGGVAGHAGLFSTAHNLSIYAQLMLNKGTYGGRRYLKEETVELFTQLQPEPGNRGLGFDLRSPIGFTTAGQFTSERTFGHLGFSGTSMWIDPDNDLAIILLTNRTYPYRSYGTAINRIRSAVSDAVMQSITN